MSDKFIKVKNDNDQSNSYSMDYRNSTSDVFISKASDKEREIRKLLNYQYNNKENNNKYHNFRDNITIKPYDNIQISNSDITIGKKKRPSIKKAVFLLLIALTAVVYLVDNVTIDSIDAVNSYQEEDFTSLIQTLVMQDPYEFDDINKLDVDIVTSASIWSSILSQSENQYQNFDSRGFIIIPSDDIINKAKELFGSSYTLELKNPSLTTFYELSEDKQEFHIKPISNHNNFLPLIDDCKNESDSIILKVGYISGNDPYRLRPQGEVEKPSVEKYMYYTLKKDTQTNKYYIHSVKA